MTREIKRYIHFKWGTPLLQKKHYSNPNVQIHYLASKLSIHGTYLFFLYTHVVDLSDNKINSSKYNSFIIDQSAASSSLLLLTYATNQPEVTRTSIFTLLQPEEVPVWSHRPEFLHIPAPIYPRLNCQTMH